MIKKIGFIGQGFLGKNYADYFDKLTDYEVVRYSLEEQYIKNADKIATCDLVFVCVPTPSTPSGFDLSLVEKVLPLVGKGKIALIKSTILPGSTRKMQEMYKDIIVLFSPEFLTEVTAAYDVKNPDRNIVGWVSDKGFKVAGSVMNILPPAPYEAIVKAEEAEAIKYGGNNWFYFKVLYVNLLYDWCMAMGIDYSVVKDGMAADKRIGRTHLEPIHKTGRGAGGHCFIKDFEAFKRSYESLCGENDIYGLRVLDSLLMKNLELLRHSGKDLDLVAGVYGDK